MSARDVRVLNSRTRGVVDGYNQERRCYRLSVRGVECFVRADDLAWPQPERTEDTDFELEKIIDERLEDGKVQYLGKWYATIMSLPEERAYTGAGYAPSIERYPDADFEAGGQKWRIVFWAPTWMPAACISPHGTG